MDLQIIKRRMKIHTELPRDYVGFRSYVDSQIVQVSESNGTYYIMFLPKLDGSWNHDIYLNSINLVVFKEQNWL